MATSIIVCSISPRHGVLFLMRQIRKNNDNLMYYLLFLRITPLLPNWFVNVSSPIVGIPVSKFVLATLIGKAVQTFESNLVMCCHNYACVDCHRRATQSSLCDV